MNKTIINYLSRTLLIPRVLIKLVSDFTLPFKTALLLVPHDHPNDPDVFCPDCGKFDELEIGYSTKPMIWCESCGGRYILDLPTYDIRNEFEETELGETATEIDIPDAC